WSTDLGAPILGGVVPSPPYLYVGTYDGTIRALVSDKAVPAAPTPKPDASGCQVGGGGGWLLVAMLLAALRRRARRLPRTNESRLFGAFRRGWGSYRGSTSAAAAARAKRLPLL
ncbi:MAG TPA: PQQ-binding-like beta-propeller repeat protein, partial [Haliangiales bacterium]|nr:PQQ-binding-like beta-propeller repeat protein [Haliangiales bacterium]